MVVSLGKVLHVTKGALMVVRSSKEVLTPKEGRRVTTRSKKPIGRVKQIFGPASRPYISVKPFKGVEAEKLKGEELFIN